MIYNLESFNIEEIQNNVVLKSKNNKKTCCKWLTCLGVFCVVVLLILSFILALLVSLSLYIYIYCKLFQYLSVLLFVVIGVLCIAVQILLFTSIQYVLINTYTNWTCSRIPGSGIQANRTIFLSLLAVCVKVKPF